MTIKKQKQTNKKKNKQTILQKNISVQFDHQEHVPKQKQNFTHIFDHFDYKFTCTLPEGRLGTMDLYIYFFSFHRIITSCN